MMSDQACGLREESIGAQECGAFTGMALDQGIVIQAVGRCLVEESTG